MSTLLNNNSHKSSIQRSKEAYKQRKEQRFIQKAKTLTKLNRLKNKILKTQKTDTRIQKLYKQYDNDINNSNSNDISIDSNNQQSHQQHRNNKLHNNKRHQHNNTAIDNNNTLHHSQLQSSQQQQQQHQQLQQTIDAKRVIRQDIKQKMNSKTIRGQPKLNKQIEVLYSKLLKQKQEQSK